LTSSSAVDLLVVVLLFLGVQLEEPVEVDDLVELLELLGLE
jgi:hypothetical protein